MKKLDKLFKGIDNTGKFLYELCVTDLIGAVTLITLPATYILDNIEFLSGRNNIQPFRRTTSLLETSLKYMK